MSDKAHIIDIDRIVLMGADLRDRVRLKALIEAELGRALGGTVFGAHQGLANDRANVAGEAARTVVQSIQGDSDDV
jgi:hypothetical protein